MVELCTGERYAEGRRRRGMVLAGSFQNSDGRRSVRDNHGTVLGKGSPISEDGNAAVLGEDRVARRLANGKGGD